RRARTAVPRAARTDSSAPSPHLSLFVPFRPEVEADGMPGPPVLRNQELNRPARLLAHRLFDTSCPSGVQSLYMGFMSAEERALGAALSRLGMRTLPPRAHRGRGCGARASV